MPAQSSNHASTSRRALVAILIFGAFVTVLNQTLMLVAIPPIMADFSASASKAQWVTTAFMLTSGICIPVSAALIDRYSSRALYLAAISLFLLGTIIGALSQTFSMLLAARILQGASAGIIMPLIQTIMMSIFPPEKRGAAMGLVGLVISFAPAIGPSLSGWIIDHYSWRSLFVILIPIVSLVLVGALFTMRNVTEQRDTRIAPFSVALSTLGWGGLLYGFSIAGSAGWSSVQVWLALGVGTVSLAVFIPQQLRLSRPMLEFRVFTNRVFTLTTLLSIIVFALMIGPQTLIPIYVQNVLGLGAFKTGLLLLPGAVVMGLMSPVAGRLFDAFGIKWLAVTGLGLIASGLALFSQLSIDTQPVYIIGGFTLHMLGISTLMMPLITAGINATPVALIAHATAMNNTLRMVGASIGTALLVTVMSATEASLPAMPAEQALLQGVRTAFSMAVGLALVGFVIAFRLDRPYRQKEAHAASDE